MHGGKAVSHAEIVQAITARGGRLVASFVLDADGQTVGHRTSNRRCHCTSCGAPGHTAMRCNGEGVAPKPTHRERRKAEAADARDWLREAAAAKTPLDEAKRAIAERIAARRAR